MAVPWGAIGQGALRAASVALTATAGECKGTIYYAVLECTGTRAAPQNAPGFDPFSLAWGWCLLGLLCGLMLGMCFDLIVRRAERSAWVWAPRVAGAASLAAAPGPPPGTQPAGRGLAAAPGLQHMPPWNQAAAAAHGGAQEGPRRVVLQRLLDKGGAVLDLDGGDWGLETR
ncbi:unnamed protein product, partial [Prorocentrum cordatum]